MIICHFGYSIKSPKKRKEKKRKEKKTSIMRAETDIKRERDV
jgi:hypothetical protein